MLCRGSVALRLVVAVHVRVGDGRRDEEGMDGLAGFGSIRLVCALGSGGHG